MMNEFQIKGTFIFDPEHISKKHHKQSSWKKVAYILFKCDVDRYYRWFINKRYNLSLAPPLRGPHITFINDSHHDIGIYLHDWDAFKKKYHGRKIMVTLNNSPRTNGENWWLNIPEHERTEIHNIRKEIGLGRPFFGLHMTVGRAINYYDKSYDENSNLKAKNMFEEHSVYIHQLIQKGLIL